jgi:hypothetical protein
MKSRRVIFIGAAILIVIALTVVATAAFVPQNTNPAFAIAVDFVQAAGDGNDAMAMPLLDVVLQDYVQNNCPDSSVSACVKSYTPPEWGDFRSAVFRRAAPDGDAWNVDLIATYEAGKGASGVCIYSRVEQTSDGWRVTEWAGFTHCGDTASRNMAANPNTPNRAP